MVHTQSTVFCQFIVSPKVKGAHSVHSTVFRQIIVSQKVNGAHSVHSGPASYF